MWSCSASLLPDPLQPSTPILQKGGLMPKPSQLTLTHPHSQFQLNQESPWTNMLEKKIKPRKAQLRGTLRAHAKKLETRRYCRGPARSLDGVTRRPVPCPASGRRGSSLLGCGSQNRGDRVPPSWPSWAPHGAPLQ